MTIKLKGICIDLKKERCTEKLNTLIHLCIQEKETSSIAKREFLKIVICMITKRIDHIVKNKPALEIV